MITDILNKFKRPPDLNWKFQRQTKPPTFGYARLSDMKMLEEEIRKRKDRCIKVLQNTDKYCKFVEGKISLVILSCKRWHTLKRLIDSVKDYLGRVKDYPNIEKVLVDNGSSQELIGDAEKENFFDRIISYPRNLGMTAALRDAYRKVNGEYILLVEDDFILDYDRPFLDKAVNIFKEFPEIGIIRLKDQNNWWKPHRVIAPLRKTQEDIEFWTWLPSKDGMLNVWCAGSAIFRKVSYFSTGELPAVRQNISRNRRMHQGYIYECVYGKEYNKYWLAAKIKDCYPFFQPNLNKESSGWGA